MEPKTRNETFDDPHAAYEAVVESLRSARKVGGWDMVVVSLGGLESLVSLMAAMDVFTPQAVLAVTT